MVCKDKFEKDVNIRKMILDRAQEGFLSYGFVNTTTEQIANDLAISKKTLYKFFPKKDDLFFAVVERMRDEFNLQISSILDSSGSFLDKAKELARIWSAFAARAPANYYRDLEKYSPKWVKELNTTESIEAFFVEGMKQGYIRDDINIHLFMVYMQVSIRHMVVYASAHQDEFSIREILTLLPKLLIEGFLTDKGRSQINEKM